MQGWNPWAHVVLQASSSAGRTWLHACSCSEVAPGRGHLAMFAVWSWLLTHSGVASWLLWEYSKGTCTTLTPSCHPQMLVNLLQVHVFAICLHPEVWSWCRSLYCSPLFLMIYHYSWAGEASWAILQGKIRLVSLCSTECLNKRWKGGAVTVEVCLLQAFS